MKKRLLYVAFSLLAVLGIVSNAQAQTANAYSYALTSVAPATDATSITVNYSLNAAATAVAVEVYNGETMVKSFPMEAAGLTAGAHSFVIPFEGLPTDVQLTWKVKVTSTQVEAPVAVGPQFSFWTPYAVIVDNNVNSDNFGRILVTESKTTTSPNYHSSFEGKVAQGIYAFDPQMNPIKNAADGYVFTGGLALNTGKIGTTTTTAFDPKRMVISEDGRIFVSRCTHDASALYEINPADLNANFTEVFKGTIDAESFEMKTADGKFVAAPNCALAVKGSGAALKLMALSTNASGIGFSYSGFRTDEYALGEAKTWDAEPANIDELSGQWSISAESLNLAYDNEGGVWYVQYRATPSEAQPAILHINAAGVEDYRDVTTVAYGAGIAYNHDKSLLAIAIGSKLVGVFKVEKSAENKPVLNKQYEFATRDGRNINAIAWDLANNMYMVSNTSETFGMYALPRESADVTIPAMEKYAFTIAAPAPEEPSIKLTQKWIIKDGLPAALDARQAAVVNGKFYIQNKATSSIEVWDANGKTETSLASGASTNITSDEAGNIIVRLGAFPNKFASDVAELRIYPAAGGDPVDVTLTGIPEARCDFFGKVRGNVLSEDGGVMYLCVTGVKSVTVVPIISGVQDPDGTYNAPISSITPDNMTLVQPFGASDITITRRATGNGIVKGVFDGETLDETYIFNTPERHSIAGSCAFTMGGVDYIVYNVSESTEYRDGFAIAKATNEEGNTIIARHEQMEGSKPNGFQSNWTYAEVVSDTETHIYQYFPGGYIAMYSFGTPAPEPQDPSLYMIGQIEATGYQWDPSKGLEMTSEGNGIYSATVKIANSADSYGTPAFAFSTVLAENNDQGGWDYVNANRYGAAVDGTMIENDVETALVKSEGAFKIVGWEYKVTVDMTNLKVRCTATTPIPEPEGLTQKWIIKDGLPAALDARQAAVVNGKFYIQNKATSSIEVWDANGKTETSLASGASTNITSDEAGNIIVRLGAFPNKFASDVAELRIYPAAGGDPVDVTLTGIPEARCDFFGKVRGNVLSEDGGVMYLCVTGVKSVTVVPIISGVQDPDGTYNAPISSITPDNMTLVQPFGASDITITRRATGNGIVKGVFDGETLDETYIFNTPERHSIAGSCAFTMGGVDYIVYNVSESTEYRDGFAIAKATNEEGNTIIARHEQMEGSKPNGFQSNWTYAEVVSDTETHIYQYYPGGYIAMYTFVAPTPAPAVEQIYVIGTVGSTAGDWKPNDGSIVLAKKEGTTNVFEGTFTPTNASEGFGFFAMSSTLGTNDTDWTGFNAGRLGAPAADFVIANETETDIVKGTDASFKIAATGKEYKATVDLDKMKITVTELSGVDAVETAKATVVGGRGEINVYGEYTTIQVFTTGGALVSKNEANVQCAAGIYIVKVDNKTVKVIVK